MLPVFSKDSNAVKEKKLLLYVKVRQTQRFALILSYIKKIEVGGLYFTCSAHIQKSGPSVLKMVCSQFMAKKDSPASPCLSRGSPATRPPCSNSPHPLTHSLHTHWHRVSVSLKEAGNIIKPLLSLHVPHWYHYGLDKAVRVRLTDLYSKCTRVLLCSG